MEAGKYRAFQVRLNSRSGSEPRTKLVAKTPNPQILARVSLCWPPISVCGKNVYALRACKRSNRDFLRLYTGNTYTFSLIQSSSITRRVLRCLLGFLALWGQKPCGGNYRKYLYILSYPVFFYYAESPKVPPRVFYPGPRGFSYFVLVRAARELRSGEHESRSGEKEKPLVTLDLNLTLMQMPAVKRVN